jgi:hypothetical protein
LSFTGRNLPVKEVDKVIDGLREQLGDVVYAPGDDEYAKATRPDNSSYRQQPCAVVRARSGEHVAGAVKAASSSGAVVVVQATGHGAAREIGNDQVLVDTSALAGVVVDASINSARIGVGAVWPAVQKKAYAQGLLGLSGTSPTVGVAGYTFGGGVSWFVRKHGLASSALSRVEYVDGTGVSRCATEDASDPLDREALWAFRGGAPVGIATSIEIGLFEIPDLAAGYLLWPARTLPDVISAWTSATAGVSASVSSSLSLLKLPDQGPFPEKLFGTTVVHLSYASADGAAYLDPMRDAVRSAAVPVVDTTGPADVEQLSAIHLDPPTAVPARGIGRWLGPAVTEIANAMFDAARIGQPDGLNMIELRNTASQSVGPRGALTTVPAPFLMHAVGAAVDDNARSRTDGKLADVEAAARSADIGRAAPSFCEGQSSVPDGWTPSVRDRLHAIRDALDPGRVLTFHRHPDP